MSKGLVCPFVADRRAAAGAQLAHTAMTSGD
jgi:hypothetical protein